MNRNYRRMGAAALLLVFCLTAAPITNAKPVKNRDRFDVREPIVRLVNKIKNLLNRIGTLDEFPGPPVP